MREESVEAAMTRIRSLCAELAERRGLSAEERDELCGHMEDKLAGYLRGDVPISVEDALVLVREHFGDADRVCRDLVRERPRGSERFFSLRFNHERVYLAALVLVGLSTTLTIPLGLSVYILRSVGMSESARVHVPNWALPWFVAISGFYIAFILVALTARRLRPAVGRRLTRMLNFALLLAPPAGTLLGLYGLLKVDRDCEALA